MTMSSLTPSDQTTASKEVIATSAIRTLVAKHSGVSLGRVTDEMHFTQDLGADWLDRLAFMMAVEEQFAGLEITDDDVDRIQVVGDLIRHIDMADNERRRQGAVPARTRSKWSRVLRYAADYKPSSEPLATFIQRKGGINSCASRFAQCLGRSRPSCQSL